VTFFARLWHNLKRLFRALADIIVAILGFFGDLLGSLLEKPIDALERLRDAIRRLLARLSEVIRTAWSRLWERAPRSPHDRRSTPGRGGIPLASGAITVTIWYLFPFADWLDLSTWEFRGVLVVSWIAIGWVLRSVCREERLGRIGQWMVTAQRRSGLIWYERGACALLFLGWWVTRGQAQASTAPLILALGFFALLISPHHGRVLTDELPQPIEPLAPGADDAEGAALEETGNKVLRNFRWEIPGIDRPQVMDVTVGVDVERYELMQSRNPKRPTGVPPDWTPWVVTGVTPEVRHAAAEIRQRACALGLSRFEETAAVLGFVQPPSVAYAGDLETTGEAEYWRYPIETIHDQHGDCEDSAILAASVLRALGYEVLPLTTDDHAAFAVEAPPGLPGTFFVHGGRHYYYCEPTATGAGIGQLPDQIDPSRIQVSPLRESTVTPEG